ncbi:MAG: adenine phosphoribosyltransferase [Chloroflexi bacterium]|nr:adenine phosphoribosyltransferase [Chloroflexota bacterium]
MALLKDYIRDVPDFPQTGIIFRDICPLLQDRRAFKEAVNTLANKHRNQGIDLVVAVEARGFIFGGAIAYELGAGFVPVRKKGKLPAEKYSVTYDLEYGTDTLEIHQDAINPGAKVLIVDDLLATGGTVDSVTALIQQLQGNVVGIAFLIELTALNGREKLNKYPVYSLIKY